MKITAVAACAAILAVCVGLASAESAPRGSVAFQPSPENPVGWRGNGSGRYPGAEPPLHWGREAMAVKELRCQAAKPKDGQTGQPMRLGVIPEWLVLGPVDLPADYPESSELTVFVDSLVPDAKSLAPGCGGRVGRKEMEDGRDWKLPSSIGRRFLTVTQRSRILRQPCWRTHTSIRHRAGRWMFRSSRLCRCNALVNGKTIFQSPKSWTHGAYRGVGTVLIKGWNSVLLKVSPHSKRG